MQALDYRLNGDTGLACREKADITGIKERLSERTVVGANYFWKLAWKEVQILAVQGLYMKLGKILRGSRMPRYIVWILLLKQGKTTKGFLNKGKK